MNEQDFIYLIGIVPGPQLPHVKIGHANDVWARLGQLQCGNPFELRVLSFFPGGQEVEGAVHRALAAYRVRGEWFDLGIDPLRMFTAAYLGRPITLPKLTKMPTPRGSAQAEQQAYDLYFDLRGTGPAPSQNAFEQAWRKAGYGMKTDDIRALYKDVHSKVTGNNA